MTMYSWDECACRCHKMEGMTHIRPCCYGQCPCGAWVVDWRAHKERCKAADSHIEPIRKFGEDLED
jgi:hypothetical protein